MSFRNAELIWTQILQGFGGGFAAVSSQVGAQASIPHADVAVVTATVLLFTEVGAAIGGALGESGFVASARSRSLPFLVGFF